jgi:hypothetical protein
MPRGWNRNLGIENYILLSFVYNHVWWSGDPFHIPHIKCMDGPRAMQVRRQPLANHARQIQYIPSVSPQKRVQECLYTATHNDWHSAWFEINIFPSREVIETDKSPYWNAVQFTCTIRKCTPEKKDSAKLNNCMWWSGYSTNISLLKA